MVGPVPSIEDVPIRDILPRGYEAAEEGVRELARELDQRAAARSTEWHWYPQRTEPAVPDLPSGIYQIVFDTNITLLNTGDDWLELTLNVAWREGRKLAVNAAVEVACWCPQDHNMHPVRDGEWIVASSHGLVKAFAAGIAMLTGVLDSGPFDPRAWRVGAGLPDAPATAR